jgi:O-antigen ligase
MNNENLQHKFEFVLGSLFIFLCAVLPWSIAGMQIAIIALLFLSSAFSLITKTSPIKYHPFYLFIGFYLLANLITLCIVDDFNDSLNAAFHNDWVIITIPFIISLPISAIWRKRAIKILIVSASVAGIYGIVQFFLGVEYIRGVPLDPFGNYYRAVGAYNAFFSYGGNQLLVFAAAFAFVLFSKKWVPDRTFYISLMLIIFLSIVVSFNRSAWIASVVVLILGTAIVNRKNIIPIAGLLIVFAIIVFFFVPDFYNRFLSIFDPSQNEGRLTVWLTSWEIIKDNFFFGIGHGNFEEFFFKYKVIGFYDATGHAHNDYINVTVVNGIVGLFAWLGIWASWFYYSFKTFGSKYVIDSDRKIVLGSILAIAGILTASIFQCFYTDLENNILWWVIAALSLQISIQSNSNNTNKQEAIKN